MRSDKVNFGAIAIGRNEGERLRRCLASVSEAARTVIYVDSGSTDGSSALARANGAEVVDLDPGLPFTAARARNAGFDRLRSVAPDLPFALFIDGDCEMTASWPEHALSFFESHPGVGVVCGRLRERHQERSIYNWLCEREWDRPAGQVRACGGIAMMRTAVVEAVGGYRADLIAGEDPELCVRMRMAGWQIWRLERNMALHDADMMRFGQWWRRAMRGGHAFAQGAYLHGASPERHFVRETRRAWLWGFFTPFACLFASIAAWPWGLATWLIYPLQVIRLVLRSRGRLSERVLLSSFLVLARFPEAFGQLLFLFNRLRGTEARLIEYKGHPNADSLSH